MKKNISLILAQDIGLVPKINREKITEGEYQEELQKLIDTYCIDNCDNGIFLRCEFDKGTVNRAMKKWANGIYSRRYRKRKVKFKRRKR